MNRNQYRPWISPFVLMTALGVGYLLLDVMIPRIRENVGSVPDSVSGHWSAPVWILSDAVRERRTMAVCVTLIAGVVSLLLVTVARPLARLVYAAAVILVVIDVFIVLGGILYFYSELLNPL